MDAASTILIADDDPISRKLIETKLFGENYTLVFANDGKEALEKTKQVVPDMILMDVMMPEMDGFAVCEQIKADPLLRHIPIILVTALDSRDDVMRGYSVGANDFLRKPVNSFELRARIRSMLSTKKQLSVLDTTVQLRDVLTKAITEAIAPGVASVLEQGQNLKQRATQPLDVDESKQLVAQAQNLETLVANLLLLVKTVLLDGLEVTFGAWAQVFCDLSCRGLYECEVRLALVGKRRGHAYDYGVDLR